MQMPGSSEREGEIQFMNSHPDTEEIGPKGESKRDLPIYFSCYAL